MPSFTFISVLHLSHFIFFCGSPRRASVHESSSPSSGLLAYKDHEGAKSHSDLVIMVLVNVIELDYLTVLVNDSLYI